MLKNALITCLVPTLREKKESEVIDLGKLPEGGVAPPFAAPQNAQAPPFAAPQNAQPPPFAAAQAPPPFAAGTSVVKVEEAPPFTAQPAQAPPFAAAQASPPSFAQSETPKVAPEFEKKLVSLESKMSQIDSVLANVRRANEETSEKLGKIEKSMEGILSIYELVTNEINPFISSEKKGKAEEYAAAPASKPAEALSIPIPELQEHKESAKRGNGHDSEPSIEDLLKPMSFEEEVSQTRMLDRSFRLERINEDPSTIMLLLKWLDFLYRKVGYNGLFRVLLYYEDVGWVSEAARNKILRYARDMQAEGAPVQERKLKVTDHIVSLYFIAKLQGIKVSPMLYSSVVNELDQLGILE